MKAYVGQTRSEKLIRRLEGKKIGECTARGELAPRRRPWFYDNGAYSDWANGRPFDGGKFERDIEWIRRDGLEPDFVVMPDIVGRGLESLRFSTLWLDRLEGLPLYIAVQDGMSTRDVVDLLGYVEGVFVGGTLPWKLKTARDWNDFAHEKKKACHVGRVGTVARVEWARTIGVDSIDSSLPLWCEEHMQAFLGALESLQGRLWSE